VRQRSFFVARQRLQAHAELRRDRLDAGIRERVEANGFTRSRKLRYERDERAMNAGTHQHGIVFALGQALLQPRATCCAVVGRAAEILIAKQPVRIGVRKQMRRRLSQARR